MAFFDTRRRLFTYAAVGLASTLAFGATALAGPVRGALELPRDAQPMTTSTSELPNHYWRVWNGVLEPRPERLDASRELSVVLLGQASGEPIGCEYTLRGGDLAPSTLAVRSGTTLSIENRDGCSHTLFAEGVFERIETPPGNARAVSIGEGGPWVVRDADHPHIEGHLHSFPDLVACGALDSRGAYTVPSVPAGEYTLKVFRGAEELASQAITVPDGRELVVQALPIRFPTSH